MDNQQPQQPQTPTPINPENLPQPPQPQFQQPTPPSTDKKVPSLLGTIGLSLAFLGIITSLVPATVILGMVVLFTAFVLSLVALFKINTLKWPAIVGLVVSVVAGVIVSLIFAIALLVNLADGVNENNSTKTPSTSEQTNEDTGRGRPSVDAIAKSVQPLAQNGGVTEYDSIPGFYPCMAEEIYQSDVSDESLWLIIEGKDPLESERTIAGDAIKNATLTCEQQLR